MKRVIILFSLINFCKVTGEIYIYEKENMGDRKMQNQKIENSEVSRFTFFQFCRIGFQHILSRNDITPNRR